MRKKLIRRIPAKRLRPGREPDDVVVSVVGLSAPVSPFQRDAIEHSLNVFYEVFADGVTLTLQRMEDVEGKFGPESVFEDCLGTCYVCEKAFNQRADGQDGMPQFVAMQTIAP